MDEEGVLKNFFFELLEDYRLLKSFAFYLFYKVPSLY